MAHYIVLANFTDQGVRSIKETSKRAKALRDAAGGMGVAVKKIFWTLGNYDVMFHAESPDDETMTALMMKVASLGNLKSQTLRAFDESEIDTVLAKI